VLDTTGSFTVSAWVNPAVLTGWTTFVVQKAATTSGLFLEYDGGSHKWVFASAGSDTVNPVTYRAESATDAQAGVWTHLVGVFNSSNGATTLYVNGSPRAAPPTPRRWRRADHG
jgi:hypothetical protein